MGLVELPSVNIGEMQNSGFDVFFFGIGEVLATISLSMCRETCSRYKNKVISLNNKPGEIRYGATLRNSSIYNASMAGQPIFYGGGGMK